MRVVGLLALVVIAVLAVLVLCLWLPSASTAAIAPDAVADAHSPRSTELEAAPSTPATIGERTQLQATRTSASSDDTTRPAEKHPFDVTFVALDALGRPRADFGVGFALDRHRANGMGRSDAKGELHVTWFGELSELDGVFGAMSKCTDWSRVHLVAGRPCVLRISAEPLRAPPATADGPAVAMHDSGPSDIAFERDADGNGVFVDQGMLVREVEEPEWHGRPSAFSSRKLGPGSRGRKPAMATIDCIVQDADGRPAVDVPLRWYPGGTGGGNDARTDANGHFVSIQIARGSLDVEIGGGVFALQRKAFDLALGDQTWTVHLARVSTVRGKLTDPDGKPLADWHVLAHEDLPPFGFLQSCETDAEGRFALGVDHGGYARLLVKPPESDDRPAVLLSDHAAAGQDELAFPMREPSRRVSVQWHFDMPWQSRRVDAVARVTRTDSGECVWLDPHEVTKTDDGFVRWRFLFDRALPGDYEIVNFGPAGCSELGVRLENDEEELGNVPIEPTMTLMLVPDDVAESEMWSAQLLTRAQGMRVRSNGSADEGKYLIPAGETELVIHTTASTAPLRKAFHGKGGEQVEVRFSTLRAGAKSDTLPLH